MRFTTIVLYLNANSFSEIGLQVVRVYRSSYSCNTSPSLETAQILRFYRILAHPIFIHLAIIISKIQPGLIAALHLWWGIYTIILKHAILVVKR